MLVAALLLLGANAFALDAVTDNDFSAKVEKAKGFVVVVASSESCPPCQLYAPNLEGASKKLTGKVKFYNLDVDKNMKLDAYLGIQATPTTYVFKDGELLTAWTGAVPLESDLVDSIKSIMANASKLQANLKEMMSLMEKINALRKENSDLIHPESDKGSEANE